MKLNYLNHFAILALILSLSTACGNAKFNGKNGSNNKNTEEPNPPPPVTVITDVPKPDKPGPGTEIPVIPGPGIPLPGTPLPGIPKPGTPLPCDKTKLTCPVPTDKCLTYGVDCPEQNDQPKQNDPGQN